MLNLLVARITAGHSILDDPIPHFSIHAALDHMIAERADSLHKFLVREIPDVMLAIVRPLVVTVVPPLPSAIHARAQVIAGGKSTQVDRFAIAVGELESQVTLLQSLIDRLFSPGQVMLNADQP